MSRVMDEIQKKRQEYIDDTGREPDKIILGIGIYHRLVRESEIDILTIEGNRITSVLGMEISTNDSINIMLLNKKE